VTIKPPVSVIPNPVRITVQDSLDARAFAERVVAGYRDGRKSTAQSLNGIELDVPAQMAAREAEMAFCKFFGLDPREALDWSEFPDFGQDVTHAGIRWDVKHAAGGKALLIWPVSKNADYDRKAFDAFALVTGNAPWMTVWGWITKADFARDHVVAQYGSQLIPGTRHLHKGRLTRFEERVVVPNAKRDRQWFLDRLMWL
jgi:hypothetical protein